MCTSISSFPKYQRRYSWLGRVASREVLVPLRLHSFSYKSTRADDFANWSLWQEEAASVWMCPLGFWTPDTATTCTPFEKLLLACYWALETECLPDKGLKTLSLILFGGGSTWTKCLPRWEGLRSLACQMAMIWTFLSRMLLFLSSDIWLYMKSGNYLPERNFIICLLLPLAFLHEAKLMTQWSSQFRVSPKCLGQTYWWFSYPETC